jgi:hypothetical protein
VPLPHSPLECATLGQLLQAFPSPSTLGEVVPHQSSLTGLFIYSSMREYPSPTLWSLPLSLLRVFFFQLLVYYSVCFFLFFFPWVGVILSGGYVDLSQVCLWEYCVPLSSPGGLLLPSRLGAGIWQHESPPGFYI